MRRGRRWKGSACKSISRHWNLHFAVCICIFRKIARSTDYQIRALTYLRIKWLSDRATIRSRTTPTLGARYQHVKTRTRERSSISTSQRASYVQLTVPIALALSERFFPPPGRSRSIGERTQSQRGFVPGRVQEHGHEASY